MSCFCDFFLKDIFQFVILVNSIKQYLLMSGYAGCWWSWWGVVIVGSGLF